MSKPLGPDAPAFPVDIGSRIWPGLTKRELMATAICAGLKANSSIDMAHKDAADCAVDRADALIERLNQPEEQPCPPSP